MKWNAYDAASCSVSRTVGILGDRWTVLVLREIFNGVRRFADIQEHLGVSRSVLTQRLSQLVDDGVLERRPYQEPGDRPRHEYRLTDLGRDLRPVLVAMMDFGDRHLAGGEPAVRLLHRDCDGEVHARLVCDCGHAVTSGREVAIAPGPGAEPLAG
ncbi:MAG: helix-turn-helix transcriptional regulator [Actinobacteria bacterium]|nr:helix-turn-helix transcriptional regulator [Actinomycetota bacterium]